MVNNDSPFLAIKALDTAISGKLRQLDMPSLSRHEQKIVNTLRNDLADARLDVRDYELSETRDMQLVKARAAKHGLERLRKGILVISEYNVFSPSEVAQLTAQLEQISDNVR